jgi:Superinfection immunity protein
MDDLFAMLVMVKLLGLDVVGVLMLLGFLLSLYFLPSMIAFGGDRYHEHRVPILLLNIFLGWSMIGWVGALVWAVIPQTNRGGR